MTTARMIVGDIRDALATIPDATVDLVLTSPPFLALRSYLPAGHPSKGMEIGQEGTPAAFVDVLLDLTAEWGRVLAPHGSIAVELGDSYSGSGGSGGDYLPGGMRDRQASYQGTARTARGGPGRTVNLDRDRWASSDGRPGWPLAKSACMVPEIYRVALVYGTHPLTGEPSPAGRWRVRNTVRWCRPNPPVGALGDKYRPATSDIAIATRSRERYFDLDAVRGDPSDVKDQRPRSTNGTKQAAADPAECMTANYRARMPSNPAGAPPLDWWYLPTFAYAGAHYATWPPALCVPLIASMCPRRVYTVCGEPSRRIVRTARRSEKDDTTRRKHADGEKPAPGRQDRPPEVGWEMDRETVGWTDCGHDSWRPGRVLDPFSGSGTTLTVATGMGRDAIGIDIDERNVELARERVGMLLTDVSYAAEGVVA